MEEILSIICSHHKSDVKKLACLVLSDVAGSNKEVQEFALRVGALNLTQQFQLESDLKVKEAVFGALYSLING